MKTARQNMQSSNPDSLQSSECADGPAQRWLPSSQAARIQLARAAEYGLLLGACRLSSSAFNWLQERVDVDRAVTPAQLAEVWLLLCNEFGGEESAADYLQQSMHQSIEEALYGVDDSYTARTEATFVSDASARCEDKNAVPRRRNFGGVEVPGDEGGAAPG